MTCDTPTRVMLVDDHQVMRDLLRDALEDTGEYQVVAQAADGAEALRVGEEIAPDVIVMDVIMPVMDGIEACREITDRLPDTRVLMLTASNDQDAIVPVHRRRGHRVPAEVLRQGAVAHHPAGGGQRGVPHPSRRGQEIDPGGARWPVRKYPGAVESLDGTGEGNPEAVCPGADLPGDRPGQGHQRADGAQRHVRHPEEVGVQDQAADGGLGRARWTGGRQPGITCSTGYVGECATKRRPDRVRSLGSPVIVYDSRCWVPESSP